MTTLLSPLLDSGPVRMGGPPVFSTCTDLVPHPLVCWDVGRYYRDLRVDWRASTGELVRAYRDRDGQRCHRLTYVLKRLLDPVFRRHYDLLPLGARLRDRYTEEYDRRARVADLAEMMRACGRIRQMHREFGMPEPTTEHILRQLGPAAAEQALDHPPSGRDNGVAPPQDYPYGYYLWGTRTADDTKLVRWQALLVSAASREGVRTRMALGVKGGTPHPWVYAVVRTIPVLFIDEHTDPDADMATSALATLVFQTTANSGECQ